jgi:ribosomal protein L17
MYRSVRVSDMRQIMQTLVEQAKTGDVAAIREVLTRCLGKPVEVDLLERTEALEQQLAEWKERS